MQSKIVAANKSPAKDRHNHGKHLEKLAAECLLIGDGTLSLAPNFLPQDIVIEYIEGASLNDIKNALHQRYTNGERYGVIILQAGATDCETENFNLDTLAAEYKILIKESKQITNGNVTVSSVCPRSDKFDNNVIELNKKIEKLSELEKCNLVNNDMNFRYVNGFPDLSVLQGQVLNVNGTKRLLENMSLPLIETSTDIIQKRPITPKDSPKPAQSLSQKSSKTDAQSVKTGTKKKNNRDKIPVNLSEEKSRENVYVKAQGHKCILSNFYKPTNGINYYGSHFESSEELYHYRKARYHFQDDLAECFRWMDSPSEINKLSKMYITDSPTWCGEGGKGEEVMYDVLCIRADQDSEFREELLSTDGKTILHTVPDKHWGTGSYSLPQPGDQPIGKNRFGVLLMKLRDKLKSEAKKKPLLPTPSQQLTSPPCPSYADAVRNRSSSPFQSAENSSTNRFYQPICYNCGESGHLQDSCRHNGPLQCFQCGYQGHKAKHCYT